MLKKLVVFLVLLAVLFTALPVSAAAQDPVIYKATVTVTNEGATCRIGFATVEFKKNFIDPHNLPVTFYIEVSAENGVPGIEITPSMDRFNKPVHIRVNSYRGLLYDKTSGRNIFVNVKRQQLIVWHFSRHAFS